MNVSLKESGNKNVFVTVGSTQFDELVTQVLHPNTLEVCLEISDIHVTCY